MEQKDIASTVTATGTFTLIEYELERISQAAPDGFSVAEMCEAVNHGPKWCCEKLRKLMAAGRVEYAGNRPVKRIDGRAGNVPVYRMVV
jgi:hypothetical protein